MSILNLPSLTLVSEPEHQGQDYLLTAEPSQPPKACPKCGVVGGYVRFGRRDVMIRDLPIHAKRVGVRIHIRRYRCKDCAAVFQDALPDVDEKRSATKRLVRYIQDQSLVKTFVSISDDVGLDEKTIRNIFREYIAELEESVSFDTPEWLGLDELFLLRKPRCIATNVAERTMIGLLPDRNKPTVERYLQLLPDRQRIKGVCMDMWKPYADAVNVILPGAVVVVDKFHVVRMASLCMDAVRKDIRSGLTDKERRTLMHDRKLLLKRPTALSATEQLKLEVWIDRFPALRAAYEAKEAFYRLYDLRTRAAAVGAYSEWDRSLPVTIRPTFQPLLTALKNWHDPIFAHFDHRITNGYTEALNGVTKVINRMGRGYSYEAIRAKMLFANGLHKQRRPKYGELPMETKSIVRGPVLTFTVIPGNHDISMGVDMQRFASEYLLQADKPYPRPAFSTQAMETLMKAVRLPAQIMPGQEGGALK